MFYRDDPRWADPNVLPLASPPPFVRDGPSAGAHITFSFTLHTTLSTNYDIFRLIAQFIEYLQRPENALGLWIAASGVVAGAHLMAPYADLLNTTL